MYKILFTDIDGTLLNRERIITQAVKKELSRINSEKMMPVILISSRMPKAMRHLHDDLNLNEPIISYNGALILKSSGKLDNSAILSSTTVPPEIVKVIRNFKSRADFHVSLYFNDEWYVEEMDDWADREVRSTKVRPFVRRHETVIKDWEDKNVGAHKIMCMGGAGEIQKLYELLYSEYPEILNLYRSKPTFIEITSKSVSKATAVEFMLNKLKLKFSEAVAVGDNYNDTEMLKTVGMGIAMGNAPEEVKKAADYTTLSNEDDGLAYAVRKFL